MGGYKGFCHGKWMEPYWIDGLKLDLTDRKVVEDLIGLEETFVKARCGDEVGYGNLELY